MVYEELYIFDETQREQCGGYLCGVDEAGRGPLAGPVVCAAVVLDPSSRYDGLTDSKKTSEKKRDVLYNKIIETAVAYSIAVIGNETIDEMNILKATMLGMKQSVEDLKLPVSLALIDGNKAPETDVECSAVVKGDTVSATIAAASILAKVTRDRLMVQYAEVYPEYGFAQHKGYPTKAHYAAVAEHGLTAIHRYSFFKRNEDVMDRAKAGRRGEETVAGYLTDRGYKILAHNYKCRYGEVDLIAQNDDYIIFCEVKTRAQHTMVSGAEAVDRHKQQRIINTASMYLQQHQPAQQPRFDVAEVTYTGEDFTVNRYFENAFGA